MWFSNTVWTFWDIFFLMFIWIPCAIVWCFAIFDVFRQRALSGIAKAAWLFIIVIFPLVGTLCYLIFRPVTSLEMGLPAQPEYVPRPAPSPQ